MKKKNVRMICFVLIFVIILAIATNYIDTGRVTTNREPKCCIKIINQDGRKITYWGLGYKVIRYVGVSPNEPYESNIGVKMGNWFMQYELPIDSEYNDKEKKDIQNLDDFYNMKLTQNKDIRSLGKEYSFFDAVKDNCFVIGAKIYHEDVYQNFRKDYENHKTAFIRIAQNTIEGDLILYDILYDQQTNQLYLVTDQTRDEYASDMDRKIELKRYEHMAEYENEQQLYLVLYDGQINDESFKTEDVFVVTMIN